MKAAVFLCNNETMGECFEKKLFGTNELYGFEVHRGDFLFLYNFSDELVYGVWIAEQNGGTYFRGAWNGRFPNQVPISLASKAMISVPRYALRRILGDGNVGQILSDYKAQNLLQYFAHNYTSELELGIELSTEETDYRRKHKANWHCEDGHVVRSKGEKIIDDWLYEHLERAHAYEPILPIPGHLIPDWVVHKPDGDPVYIEYWGILNDPSYETRRLHKSKLYAQYRLPLVELEPEHLRSLDSFLLPKLRGKGVVLNRPAPDVTGNRRA